MKENKYDDNIFFQKYSQMSRSQQGLAGAGEWETLRKIINHIVEPQPPEYMMDIPGMQDEMRRPMMLIVSANKKVDR